MPICESRDTWDNSVLGIRRCGIGSKRKPIEVIMLAREHALQVELVPEPLKGQTIHEVELRAELEAIEEGP
jgi:hypothetical protein